MRKLLYISFFILSFSFSGFGQDSSCPVINLNVPPSDPGLNGIGNFSVTVSKDSKDPLNLYKGEKELEYFWTVENGRIISGQGTVSINVQFNSEPSITATVEVKGLPENCPDTASAKGIYDPAPKAKVIAKFPTSAPQLDKSKLDNLIASLKGDLTTFAYVIISADENISRKKLKQKESEIRKYLSDKKAPIERIVVVKGGERKDLIRLFIVPQGASPPVS
jgi:hypothetical protein